jgi:hypothetical protein
VIAHRSKTGELTVTANVMRAKILIDSQAQSNWLTPHRFRDLKPGRHSITVTKDGYDSVTQMANLKVGANDPVRIDLQPLPPPPPPPSKFGRLEVRASARGTRVAGARISIDGQTQPDWLTPHVFPELAAGPHDITVRNVGYETSTQKVTVEPGGLNSIDIDLKLSQITAKQPSFGNLTVASNISGAKIRIDGRAQADWLTPHTFAGLPAGPHTVTVIADGYQTASQVVTVVAGGSISPTLNLRPSNPNPATGELVVTSDPQGAKIVIDGADTGSLTPHTFPAIAAGAHAVSLLKNGFDTTGKNVNVEAGKSATVSVSLSQPTARFMLAVLEVSESNPEGVPIAADVFIDGKPYGKSPVETGLPPGEHHYKVIAGSRSEQGRFEIGGGFEINEVHVKIPKSLYR